MKPSDTPMTDERLRIIGPFHAPYPNVDCDFARKLERKLAEAKAQQYALAKNFADMQERVVEAMKQRDEAWVALNYAKPQGLELRN